MLGTILGPYTLLAKLGQGGMGEVYRAHDARLNRDVAIKVLPDSLSRDADRLLRFSQEARAAAALADLCSRREREPRWRSHIAETSPPVGQTRGGDAPCLDGARGDFCSARPL